MAQPLQVPACGQGPHAQVDEQPHGKQYIGGVAVDQRRNEDKHRQQHDAAFEQSGIALVGKGSGQQRILGPLGHRQSGGTDELRPAQNLGARGQILQAQAKTGARVEQAPLVVGAIGFAERFETATIPAGEPCQVARGKLDRYGVIGPRRRHGKAEPERRLHQMGVMLQNRCPALQCRLGIGRCQRCARIFEHTQGQAHRGIVLVPGHPGQQGKHRQRQHGAGQRVDQQARKGALHGAMKMAPASLHG